MKTQLIKIEIKIAILLSVLVLIGVFVNQNPLLLLFIASIFTTLVISDYRDYQESDEFINSLYR